LIFAEFNIRTSPQGMLGYILHAARKRLLGLAQLSSEKLHGPKR
jgi:hypothetical protein